MFNVEISNLLIYFMRYRVSTQVRRWSTAVAAIDGRIVALVISLLFRYRSFKMFSLTSFQLIDFFDRGSSLLALRT